MTKNFWVASRRSARNKMRRFHCVTLLLLICSPVLAQKPSEQSTSVAGASQGPATDRGNNPVFDPSQNVNALVEAEAKRQDQLRDANNKLTEEKIKRLDDLRAAESRRVDEQATLRSVHATELRTKESDRIDSIRSVDVAAVAAANAQNTQTAATLAAQVTASAEALRNQVTASADALRNLVATTATAQAEQNRQQTLGITERLTALEKTQNESKGRSGVADPQMATLVEEMRSLTRANATGQGKSDGVNATTILFMTLGGLILTGLGLVYTQSRKNGAANARPA